MTPNFGFFWSIFTALNRFVYPVNMSLGVVTFKEEITNIAKLPKSCSTVKYNNVYLLIYRPEEPAHPVSWHVCSICIAAFEVEPPPSSKQHAEHTQR